MCMRGFLQRQRPITRSFHQSQAAWKNYLQLKQSRSNCANLCGKAKPRKQVVVAEHLEPTALVRDFHLASQVNHAEWVLSCQSQVTLPFSRIFKTGVGPPIPWQHPFPSNHQKRLYPIMQQKADKGKNKQAASRHNRRPSYLVATYTKTIPVSIPTKVHVERWILWWHNQIQLLERWRAEKH